MSTDNKLPLIYRFTNATVVHWRGSRPGGDVSVISDAPLATSTAISKEIQDKLKGYSSGYEFFEASEGDLTLEHSSWSRELISYVPLDVSNKQLRVLTAEEFEQLTPGFQRLYKKDLSEPIETKTELEFEVKTVDRELKESILMGTEFVSDLHKDVYEIRQRVIAKSLNYYSHNTGPAPAFDRILPLAITSDELIKLIARAGQKIGSGAGFGATVGIVEPYRSEAHLKISFFAQPYDGSVKKKPDLKRDGKPYADGRGRMVKDLPSVVGTAEITTSELGTWWDSIGGNLLSDEDKQEAIQALTNNLWKV